MSPQRETFLLIELAQIFLRHLTLKCPSSLTRVWPIDLCARVVTPQYSIRCRLDAGRLYVGYPFFAIKRITWMIAATAETAAAAINQCVKEAIVSVLLSMDFTTEFDSTP